jgi:pilus assembly protein CpaE
VAQNTLAQPAAESGQKTVERSTVLAFVTDADSEMAVREGMAELVPSIQLKRASIRQATAMLRKLPSPEVLVVDITGEDAPLAALHDLSEVVEPSTRVLVVGDRVDMNFYRSLTRDLGVAEYLYKPLAKEMVARMFGPACMQRPVASGALQGGRIVAVSGACGGVGTTTVAANLAWYLGGYLYRQCGDDAGRTHGHGPAPGARNPIANRRAFRRTRCAAGDRAPLGAGRR